MFKNKSSLYRIYRPSTFKDLAGHKNVVNILKTELLNNSFAHAFLFAGQRGTGKTSVARIFAKAVNCKNLIDGNPCDNCESCISANEGKSPDIFEIDAASNNGVDEIRNIKSNVTTLPILGKYKIYIIDEVHMLSKGAFNALLKTLEEPPVHALFILATTEYAKIPATIVSRCQTFNFKKIDKESLEERIEFICQKENFRIDKETKQEIYYLSDGSLRDALNILEQLMISSNGDITLDLMKNIFYIASNKEKFNVIKNIILGNSNELISYFETAEKQGMDFDVFALSLIEMLKEIIEYKLTNNEEFVSSISVEEIKSLNVDVEKLFNIADNLSEAYSKTKGTNINFNYILISVLKNVDFSNNKNNVQEEPIVASKPETIEFSKEPDVVEFKDEMFENKELTSDFNQELLKVEDEIEDRTTIIEQPIIEEKTIIFAKEEPTEASEPPEIIETIEESTQIISEPEIIEINVEQQLKTKSDLLTYYADKIVENTASKAKINIEIDEVVNMLLGAKKEERELIDRHFKKWFEFNDNDELVYPELAKEFIIFKDSKINAVSENEILIVCDSNSSSEAIENELSKSEFREKLFNNLGREFAIYAIDNNKWNVVKNDFITKKKNNLLPTYKPTNPKEYYSNALNKALEQNPESKELMEKASYLFGDLEVTIND